MWLKKKSVLIAEGHYNTEKSADGTTDLRTTFKNYHNFSSSIHHSGLPSAADAGNYFYLPALGYYTSGQLRNVGATGYCWSSTARPYSSDFAFYLIFSSGYVGVNYYYRYDGYRVGGFE